MAAYVYWFAGSLPVVLLLNKPVAILTIAVTLLGDTFAALFGVAFGSHKLPTNSRKSWEGTLAGTATSFLVAFLFSSSNLPLSMVSAAVFAIIDMLKLPIDDNFLMPLVLGLALQATISLQTGLFP